MNAKHCLSFAALVALLPTTCCAWISSRAPNRHNPSRLCSTEIGQMGNLHGQGACFLPLEQLDQDFIAPRIVQIAGAYPGLSKEDFMSVKSTPAAVMGQWTYDFSDPSGPQLGTVAVPGGPKVRDCIDPVAIIAEHFTLGVELPDAIKDPVDLVVLVDRSQKHFAERRFLVLDMPGNSLSIAAFNTKAELPAGSEILGHVEIVLIPWLPSMKSTKSGFAEVDDYFSG